MFRRRQPVPVRPTLSPTLSSLSSQSARPTRSSLSSYASSHTAPGRLRGFADPHSRKSGSFSSQSAYTHSPTGSRSSSMASGSLQTEELEFEYDDEMDDADIGVRPSRRRRRKDEPMSPVAVVLYVVFFYTIWQILTRSDDGEILAHLPPTSPLRNPFGIPMDHSSPASSPYGHMPYHLPALPSPSSAQDASPSTLRLVFGVAMYPIYLALALLAIPVPYLFSFVLSLLGFVGVVLSPFTMTVRLIMRTFVVGPLGLLSNCIAALFPIYVFVGAVVTVGLLMGLGAGWVGQVGLDYLLRKKSGQGTAVKQRKSRRDPHQHHRHSHDDDRAADYDATVRTNANDQTGARRSIRAGKQRSDAPERSQAGYHAGTGRFVKMDRADRSDRAREPDHHRISRRRGVEGSSARDRDARQAPTSDSDLTEVPVAKHSSTGVVHAGFDGGDSADAGTAREPVTIGTRRRERRL
ncbi:hypothetical protein Q5752_001392 [Cryptotrichosporon argae]